MTINWPALQPVLTAVSTILGIISSLVGLAWKGRHRGVLILTFLSALALLASFAVIFLPAILSTNDSTRVMVANLLAWAGLGLSFLSWFAAVLAVLTVRRLTAVSSLWIAGLILGLVLYPIAFFLSGIFLYVLTLLIPMIVGLVGPVDPASKKDAA